MSGQWMHLLDSNSYNDPDRNPDSDPENFAPCKWGIVLLLQ